jgi:hypothetical protein
MTGRARAEKITMRIPQQVSERVKEAPAQALRAVFSGIGQVLLVADRIKSRAAEPERGQSVPVEPVPQPTATTVKDETRWRSLDETGNVRLISGEDTSEAKATTTPPVPEARGPATAPLVPEAREATEVTEVTEVTEASEATEAPSVVAPEQSIAPGKAVAAEQTVASEQTSSMEPAVTPEASATSLPVPNYDNLTLPSLRARLRSLDPAQLHALLDYEKANAGRSDVLTMFERRISKLESDGA